MQVEVRRVVEITMEAPGRVGDGTGARMWAEARISPLLSEPERGLERGECVAGNHAPVSRGAWAGPEVTLDHGQKSVLSWSAATGTYRQDAEAAQRDLSWQPVSAWTGQRHWRLFAPGALQFGDTPLVVHAAHRSDGTLSV